MNRRDGDKRGLGSTRRPTLLGLLGVVLWTVAFSGCGSGLPIRYYTLDVAAQAKSASVGDPTLRIGVGSFSIEPPYDQDRIAYRPPGVGHEIAFYHYHRWAVPLSRSVQSGLADALDALDGVHAELARPDVTYDAVVVGRLWRLEEIDEASGAVRVVLELEAGSADHTERQSLVIHAPVATKTVDAVVAAFAEALREAARRIAEEVLER
jgi:uncharacterized lipoprotein YmbA